ncbi:lysozyme inhibitor LprI family protein [Aeromonas simiae]|uniref:lysozyme inhibitor LprI family protein n=1 Tax=Aeromonas simiae TaxID=218936 RepID=UPI0009FE575B|nr:lysozyme inhibitor LprI family protein [Aeromonas simiae]
MDKIIVLLSVIVSFSVFSEECSDRNTEGEMYECISNVYKRSDRELNNIYNKKMKELDLIDIHGEGADVKPISFYLKKNQQAWIKMRDTGCDLETYESMTGTGYGTIYKSCLIEKTNERISFLKLLFP